MPDLGVVVLGMFLGGHRLSVTPAMALALGCWYDNIDDFWSAKRKCRHALAGIEQQLCVLYSFSWLKIEGLHSA